MLKKKVHQSRELKFWEISKYTCPGLSVLNVENMVFFSSLSSSSSPPLLHGLGESPVLGSSMVVSLSIFLVYLYLIFQMVDIYMLVVECGYVPFSFQCMTILVKGITHNTQNHRMVLPLHSHQTMELHMCIISSEFVLT
jgi:hypothetical protein